MSGGWRSLATCGDVCSDTLEIHGLVLKKRPVDLQKRFPIHPANSKYLAANCCGLAIPLDHDKVEVTLVDWERGMVHCALTRHP